MNMHPKYAHVHYEARKVLGGFCVSCGSSEQLQAALRPGADPHRLLIDPETGCKYSLSADDYETLCVRCHRQQDLVDGRPRCANGHEYTPENTRMKNGARVCRTCHRERESARILVPENRAKKAASDRSYRRANPLTQEQKQRKLALQRNRRARVREIPS